MRILADENVDAAIVHWLRQEDHDVFWAAETASSSLDADLVRIAQNQSRILITSDLDFGELAYRQGLVPAGVVLMRFRAVSQHDRLDLLQAHWPTVASRAQGHFIVLQNRRLRIRPIKRAGS